MSRFSWNLGASTSWKPQDLSRPVMGLLYLYLLYVKYKIRLCVREQVQGLNGWTVFTKFLELWWVSYEFLKESHALFKNENEMLLLVFIFDAECLHVITINSCQFPENWRCDGHILLNSISNFCLYILKSSSDLDTVRYTSCSHNCIV
jgi:hypothetical protein